MAASNRKPWFQWLKPQEHVWTHITRSSSTVSSTAPFVITESGSFHLSALSPLVLVWFSSCWHDGCSYSMGLFSSSQSKKMSNFFFLLHRLEGPFLRGSLSKPLLMSPRVLLVRNVLRGHSLQPLPTSVRSLPLSPLESFGMKRLLGSPWHWPLQFCAFYQWQNVLFFLLCLNS